MSREHAPVLTVKNGETVTVHTYDCFKDRLIPDDSSFDSLLFDELNPATGPIFVEGAKPGDTLKAEILDISLAPTGVTEIDSEFGCLAHLVKTPAVKRLPVRNGKIGFSPRLSLDLKPMVGVIGVARQDRLSPQIHLIPTAEIWTVPRLRREPPCIFLFMYQALFCPWEISTPSWATERSVAADWKLREW